jgi:CRISPR-associated protein Csd1
MSWMSDLVKTYDACESAAGLGEADKMLIPVGFTTLDTQIEIIINHDSTFVDAQRSKKLILCPASEEAEARTSKLGEPYPLVNYADILSSSLNEYMFNQYVKILEDWGNGNEKLEALLKYIKNGTILKDLTSKDIQLKQDSKGKYTDRVRFVVNIPDDNCPKLWKDTDILKKWTDYYISKGEGELCYVSGNQNSRRMKKHPKKIISKPANAKLISSNENGKITWSGRFTSSSQALSVSYESSQKAHQALRWLIKNAAYERQSQKIIIWKVSDDKNKDIKSLIPDFNYMSSEYEYDIEDIFIESQMTDDEKKANAFSNINISYSTHIKKAIDGFANVKKEHLSTVDILAVDATTDNTGRLSITFFEQLAEDEYLQSVAYWQESCSWFIHHKNKKGYFIDKYVYSPNMVDIITACHGLEPKSGSENYTKIAKQEQNLLLHCVFRQKPLPLYMVHLAINKASNPLSFKKENKFDYNCWRKTLSVACALVRKKLYDNNKELVDLKLDETCTDRNYLFGRLLAVAERIEMVSRWKKHISKAEERPTNALNYMSAFQAHPFMTWETIYRQIRPYRQHLNGAEWYQRQIDEIIAKFEPEDFSVESDKALNGKYLLGYSLQRMQYNNKNNKSEVNENEFTEQN